MKTDLLLATSSGSTLDPDGGWAPAGVRGVDKLGQRVIYATLTPKGSVPGREGDGSSFLALVQSFRSEFDVFVAWATAVPEIVTSVRAAEAADEPDSEKLGALSLRTVAVTAGVLTLTLDVTAVDGSTPTTPVSLEVFNT